MKRILPGLIILIFMAQTINAQSDSTGYESKPFQFTFLFPPLSTNGIDNVNTINKVSLNLFLGVSGGVEAFEAAGFINIDRHYMHGVQLAGFGNTVGTHVTGAQAAGFYNIAGNRVDGFQGAGFVNVAGSEVVGAQAAGFVNVAGDSLNGFQGAGFVNVASSAKNGVQAAGFGNVAGAGSTKFQGAGFFNVAEEVTGAQLAGFINVAGNVKGTQLAGFINICDSIDGIPLSFISIVKKNGYRGFSFSVSEVQYANLSYKMGVKKLYTIYSFGKPFGPASRWMYGAGLGTQLDLANNLQLNIEGTVHQELWVANVEAPHFLYVDRLNLYNSVKFLFGWNMDNQVTFNVGPTLNLSVANSNPNMGQLAWHKISPYSVFNHTSANFNQSNVQMWFGIQGSISF